MKNGAHTESSSHEAGWDRPIRVQLRPPSVSKSGEAVQSSGEFFTSPTKRSALTIEFTGVVSMACPVRPLAM